MAEPTLEGLPTELKIQILRQVPVADLKSLVLASPVYHQSYLLVRQGILERHAHHDFDEDLDLVEALTVVRSKGLHFTNKREEATALLDVWRRRNEIREREDKSPSHLFKANSLEEVIELLHFYKKLSFFLEDFSINAPKPARMPLDQWKTNFTPLKFSTVEKRRFLRAFCRLQTVSNIFGEKMRCVNYGRCGHSDSCLNELAWQRGETTKRLGWSAGTDIELIDHAYRLFYATIPPWEYEEMGSVFAYLKAKLETISEEIKHDLRQLCKSTPCEFFWDIMPKEERPPSGSYHVEVERDLVAFKNKIPGLAGLGPEFLYRILQSDRLARRNLFCVNCRQSIYSAFIGLDLCGQRSGPEVEWPLIEPADQHDRPGFELYWSTLPLIEQPTTAWKKAWLQNPHDEQDDLEFAMGIPEHGHVRSPEEDWDWCYALWDDERLEEWKGFLSADEEPRE